jgi:23S rRNA (cytosine1962-C5)-methyltransferase
MPAASGIVGQCLPDIHLKSGKDRPVRFGHPWIFSGAIRDLDPSIDPGSLVRVRSASGDVLGTGYVNPRCAIAVRLLSDAAEPIDAAFVRRRLASALTLRRAVVAPDTNAYRLINGEGDGLPGFLADRYDDVIVLQCLTAGADRLRPLLLESLLEMVRPRAVVERSEGGVRRAEGLEPRLGVLHGEPAAEVVALENGLWISVTPAGGQKTGHFCDQRPNRRLLRDLARGRRVLDCFAYTGGFSLHAAAGGAARVVSIDSSAQALAETRRNWDRNGYPADALELVRADVPRYLRETGESFDLLVLDPPALVKQRKDLARGSRAYKDVNLWALRRSAPDALLLTFTCSQHVGADLFRKIVLGAAVDARRRVQILRHLGPGGDHPIALGHPEGEHLRGLLLRVE